jgi:hypothetical protein
MVSIAPLRYLVVVLRTIRVARNLLRSHAHKSQNARLNATSARSSTNVMDFNVMTFHRIFSPTISPNIFPGINKTKPMIHSGGPSDDLINGPDSVKTSPNSCMAENKIQAVRVMFLHLD